MAIAISKIANPKRILAIKFSSIGDIVLTTSPIKSLKSHFPSAKIDFLTLQHFVPIIEGNKYIDTIIPFNKNARFSELIKIGKWINKSNYDLVIDFHNSLRSKIIRIFIQNIPKLFIKKPRWKRLLLFRFRKNRFDKSFSQLQLLHQPIKELMEDSVYPRPELFVSNEEKRKANLLLSSNRIINQYIVIIPGAAWPQKTWGSKNYCKLISDISKQSTIDFVLLGSENDTICDEIAMCDSSILNLKGRTSLREAIAIIANSNYAIGADTGLIHIAEAIGKKNCIDTGANNS